MSQQLNMSQTIQDPNGIVIGIDEPSANDDKTTVCNGYADLARECLQKGYNDAQSALRFYEGLNPNFKKDEIFQSLFPIVFNIENMKQKLN